MLLDLNFRTGGNGRPALGLGWSFEEQCGTWTQGTRSEINLPPLPRAHDHRLELDVVPFLAPPDIAEQTLDLHLNGAAVLSTALTLDHQVTTLLCKLPRGLLRDDGPNVLQLRHPKAGRPSQYTSYNPDTRALAVRLLALRLRKIGQASKRRSVAVLTVVYNEAFNLPIWLRYYARAVPQAELFVLDHGSSDGSTDQIAPATRIKLPRHENDETTKARCVNDLQHAFLKFYDLVVFVDCDELLVPDPQHHASLADYLQEMEAPFANAVGLNVLHVPGREPAIDGSRPLLRQRTWCQFTGSMCKPSVTRVDMNWSVGFHDCDQAPRIDPTLFLFHIKSIDMGRALGRQQIMREITWSMATIKAGFGLHQRASDESFLEHFFYEPARLIAQGKVERFDFGPELGRWQAEIHMIGQIHATPHFRGRIAVIPEEFRDCF